MPKCEYNFLNNASVNFDRNEKKNVYIYKYKSCGFCQY